MFVELDHFETFVMPNRLFGNIISIDNSALLNYILCPTIYEHKSKNNIDKEYYIWFFCIQQPFKIRARIKFTFTTFRFLCKLVFFRGNELLFKFLRNKCAVTKNINKNRQLKVLAISFEKLHVFQSPSPLYLRKWR